MSQIPIVSSVAPGFADSAPEVTLLAPAPGSELRLLTASELGLHMGWFLGAAVPANSIILLSEYGMALMLGQLACRRNLLPQTSCCFQYPLVAGLVWAIRVLCTLSLLVWPTQDSGWTMLSCHGLSFVAYQRRGARMCLVALVNCAREPISGSVWEPIPTQHL